MNRTFDDLMKVGNLMKDGPFLLASVFPKLTIDNLFGLTTGARQGSGN